MATRPTIASLTAERDRLATENAELRSKALVGEEAVEAYKTNLTSRAHEYAEKSGFCEQFDEAMEALGLTGRDKDYEVQVTIRVRAGTALKAGEIVQTTFGSASVTDGVDITAFQERGVEDTPTHWGGFQVVGNGTWWEITNVEEA